MLELSLLGGFEVRRAGRLVRGFESRKVRALFAYLAMTRGRPCARDRLAGLLWPDRSVESAFQCVRQALYNLRVTLDDRGRRVIRSDQAEVHLAADAPIWIDCEQMLLGLDGTAPSPPSRTALETAIHLYRGDFLEGLHVGAEDFDDWLDSERVRFRELAVRALLGVLAILDADGRSEECVQYARRLLEIDPLSEEAHQFLIRFLAQSGRRSNAIAHYHVLCRRLDEELGISPSDETVSLYGAVLAGTFGADHPGPEAEPREPFLPLAGRETAWQHLQAVWDQVRLGRPQVSLVEGEAGIGKTRLVKGFLDSATRSTGAIILLGRSAPPSGLGGFGSLAEAVASCPEDVSVDPVCRSGLAALSSVLPGLAALRGDLPASRSDRGPSAKKVASEVIRFLVSLTKSTSSPEGRRPAILVLDDVHLAASSFREAFTELTRELVEGPIWLVGLRATATAGVSKRRRPWLSGADRLVLGRLARADVEAIAGALAVPEDAERLASFLYEASRGLPAAVAEATNLLMDDAVLLPGADGRWRLIRSPDVPAGGIGWADLATLRIARLPTVSRRLLTLASVVGERFDTELLEVAEREHPQVVAAALEILIERRFVRPWLRSWRPERRERDRVLWAQGTRRGLFEFAQPGLRDLLYGRVALSRRQHLHKAVAEALEACLGAASDQAQGLLGHHWSAAGSWEKAIPYLRAAAQRAASGGDPATAERFAKQAHHGEELVKRPNRSTHG